MRARLLWTVHQAQPILLKGTYLSALLPLNHDFDSALFQLPEDSIEEDSRGKRIIFFEIYRRNKRAKRAQILG